jgi:isoamylase
MRSGPRLGSYLEGAGTTFSLRAPRATRVELALFNQDSSGQWHEIRSPLQRVSGDQELWSQHIPGIGLGQRYGYRIDGEWDPIKGSHFNPAKLLIDPYAHLLDGQVAQDPAIFAHHAIEKIGGGEISICDNRDSFGFLPLSIVTDFEIREIIRPNNSWSQTLIYEAHVEGFTKMNHQIPAEIRGTYAALGESSTIEYLQRLGVTALELLPIQHFVTEPAISARGRENFWGYNPIAFQALHPAYSSTKDPVRELQNSIDSLHRAGIEVILDLVFNHTGEGGKDGAMLSWRGIDALAYYLHDADGNLLDFTGCGNTINASHPMTQDLIIDSLLWWSEVIGVDGFRFDLTTTLARDANGTASPDSSELIARIHSDPVLSQRKLIAEPWDMSGYCLGAFPKPWREWNDRYRDGVRNFWLGQHATGADAGVADLARRVSGSDDLFHQRGPDSSINFITAHDGFTLHDLVRYQEKQNFANGESNRDGSNENRSWNLGVEGPTNDPAIEISRTRLQKSMLATLLLSAGVPMLTMGDERSRSQSGSNNAFTIDRSESSLSPANFNGGLFLSWQSDDPSELDLLATVERLAEIRSLYLNHLITDFFTGSIDTQTKRKDIAWFRSDGLELNDDNWHERDRMQLAIFYEAKEDQGLLLLLNGSRDEVSFKLPDRQWGDSYRSIFDSTQPVAQYEPQLRSPDESTTLSSHSVQVWLVHHITVA